MSDESRASRVREWVGAAVVALAVALQSLAAALCYPAAHLDADLLSYLVYYRQLASGEVMPFGYTVPKVLPIVLLGPLGDPWRAMLVSIAIASLGGAILYVLAHRVFGAAVAALAGALYVLGPLRIVLTIRSNVDLYIGVALLGAILLLREGRVWLASVAILVAALGKPVAVAASLAILAVPAVSLRRRFAAMTIPLVALPATALLSAALDGRPLLGGFHLPDQHQRFVQVAQGVPLGLSGALHLLVIEWFGGTLFSRSWPFVLIGVAVCAVRWLRVRDGGLHRDASVLLVPLLLAAAYLGLARIEPMVVFTRFFWLLSVTLMVLAVEGAFAVARRVAGSPVTALGVVLIALVALLADRSDDYRWREHFMLDPFERYAAATQEALDQIAREPSCEGPTIVPLAYLPLAAWRAPQKLARGELCAAEDWADGRGCRDPKCALFIPEALTRERAREAVARLIDDRTWLGGGDESGALVRWKHT